MNALASLVENLDGRVARIQELHSANRDPAAICAALAEVRRELRVLGERVERLRSAHQPEGNA